MDEEKPVVDRNSLLSTRGTFRELVETLTPESLPRRRSDRVSPRRARHPQALPGASSAEGVRLRVHAPGDRRRGAHPPVAVVGSEEHPDDAGDVIRTQADEVRSTMQKRVDSGRETRKSRFT